jgi:outer membrane protein TolC
MITRILNVKVWAAALAAGTMVAAGAAVQAQQPAPQIGQTAQTPPPATPPQTPAPQQVPLPAFERYVVGRAKPPELPGSTITDLTLEQAYQIALERNLDLQRAKMDPILQDYNLRSLRATYLPRFTSSYNYSNNSQVSENTLEGVTRTVNQSQGVNTGVNLTLPWRGMTVGGSFNNSRGTTNVVTARLNPTFSSSLSANFSMPLLAGFAIDGTRNQLKTFPIQRQITDITLQATIEATKNQIRTAYWNLRQSIEAIEIAKLGLEMAKRQFADSQVRVQIGTLAAIETATPEAQVANAELSLLNAEIAWRNSELTFKRLLVTGIEDEMYRATINPVDVPTAPPPPAIDIPSAIQTALSQRSDVQITQRNLEVQEMGLEITRNNMLPSLSVSSSFSARGTGGNVLQAGTVVAPGGWSDALAAIAGLDTPQWSVGLNFSYPLGMVANKAAFARAQIQLDQQRLTAKGQQLTIQTDVTRVALQVENTYKQLEQAQRNRQIQERALQAELTRFDVGLSNNFQVASMQQTVTQARNTELGRLIAYVNALADFERVLKYPN